MTEESEYGLVMRFLDPSPSFCHGYEVGLLHARMERGEAVDALAVHAANREQVDMLARSEVAARHRYELTWRGTEVPGWLSLTATPNKPRPPFKVIPGGLA